MINFPRININTTNSKLIINKKHAKMNISGIQADIKIDKKPHTFSIRTKYAKVKINNYPAMQQLNGKNNMDLTAAHASLGRRKAAEMTSRISSEGDELMKIESGGDPIPGQAVNRASEFANSSINIAFFPRNSIQTRVEKGYSHAYSQVGSVKTNVYKNLKINYEKAEVHTDITNYPKVDIDVVGGKFDIKI